MPVRDQQPLRLASFVHTAKILERAVVHVPHALPIGRVRFVAMVKVKVQLLNLALQFSPKPRPGARCSLKLAHRKSALPSPAQVNHNSGGWSRRYGSCRLLRLVPQPEDRAGSSVRLAQVRGSREITISVHQRKRTIRASLIQTAELSARAVVHVGHALPIGHMRPVATVIVKVHLAPND